MFVAYVLQACCKRFTMQIRSAANNIVPKYERFPTNLENTLLPIDIG